MRLELKINLHLWLFYHSFTQDGGLKRKISDVNAEPSPYDIVKKKSNPGSIIHELTNPDDSIFGCLLVSVSSPHGVAPECVITRFRVSDVKARSFYLRRSSFSALLAALERIQTMIAENDLETRIKLCDRTSLTLTVYHGLVYVSFQYDTGKTTKSPYYTNLSLEEYSRFHQILKEVRAERDKKLQLLKSTMMDDSEKKTLPQITLHDITYIDPETNSERCETFFNLEGGIKILTEQEKKIVGTTRRRVDLPSVASVALMFASILLRCKRDGLLVNLDHVILSRHLEEFYSKIGVSPALGNELLSLSKWALDSQRPFSAAFAKGSLLNAVLSDCSYVAAENYIPDTPAGWTSKLGVSPLVSLIY